MDPFLKTVNSVVIKDSSAAMTLHTSAPCRFAQSPHVCLPTDSVLRGHARVGQITVCLGHTVVMVAEVGVFPASVLVLAGDRVQLDPVTASRVVVSVAALQSVDL